MRLFTILIFILFTSCSADSDLFNEIISQEESETIEETDSDEIDQEENSENNEDAEDAEDLDESDETSTKLNLIFDTDANNELDDQHALAYLISSGDLFNLEAVTVNATSAGGNIDNHFEEAERVVKLYGLENTLDIYKGANGSFEQITQNWNPNNFDGNQAVDFIIEKSKEKSVLIIAVGKLTNVALALRKDPDLANRAKVIWLGSNYPSSGEYNQINDLESVNYVLDTSIPLEMVIVRFFGDTGTYNVRVSQNEINQKMPNLGPQISTSVAGRHGGSFTNFGDYSVSLFQGISYSDAERTRALHDVVPLALLKNQEWGVQTTIPAPMLQNGNWVNRPENTRTIKIWELFDEDKILMDFFDTIENYILVD